MLQLLPIIFVGTVTDIAGEVVEVGSEVTKLKAGDKVVAKLRSVVCFNDVAVLCCLFAYCCLIFYWCL